MTSISSLSLSLFALHTHTLAAFHISVSTHSSQSTVLSSFRDENLSVNLSPPFVSPSPSLSLIQA